MISFEILSIKTQFSMFVLQNDNKLTQNCQKLWREKTIKSGGFQYFRRRSYHSENCRLLFICYHPNLYKKNILRFRIIVYLFQVFQTSGNPSLSIFTLLEPYDASSPPYIEFKWNLHLWEAKHLTIWSKNLTDKLRHKKISQSKHQHFFSIKNQWKKEWLWKSNTLGNQ